MTVHGSVCNGALHLAPIKPLGGETSCEDQATLAADVARNTCLLNGGTTSECQLVWQTTYDQVFEECNL